MVRRLMVIAVIVCAGMTVGADRALAQAPPAAKPASVPLKVNVAILRLKGDKQVGRLPFELWVNSGSTGTIRLGSEVPVPTTTFNADKTTAVTSFSYRSLGTNITCSATDLGDGRYRLELSIEDSQVLSVDKSATEGGRPAFQSFQATAAPILRDGQTVQHSVATDKVSGEVVKVEITLQVIK